MLTPIYIQFGASIEPLFEDSNSRKGSYHMSDDEHYLMIHQPANARDVGLAPMKPTRYNIGEDGRVYLQLEASVGYGQNCSYKVEYWAYRYPKANSANCLNPTPGAGRYPNVVVEHQQALGSITYSILGEATHRTHIVDTKVNLRPKLQNELLRTEYWRVPMNNGMYVLNHRDSLNREEYLAWRRARKTDLVTLDPNPTLNHSYEIPAHAFEVFKIVGQETGTEYTIPEMEKTETALQLNWTGTPLAEKADVYFYIPFGVKEIVHFGVDNELTTVRHRDYISERTEFSYLGASASPPPSLYYWSLL